MNPVVEALALLTPFDINKPKVRIGPETDGGYVFVDDISPAQAIISYGISTEYRFDAEMARRGHDVYMFDHTIEGIEASHAKMHFHREGVAGVSRPDQSLYSIEDHLAKHGVTGDRLILKIDVEGAEFDAIGMASDAVLARFEQIVIEVHGLTHLADPAYRDTFVAMLAKINKVFTLFHVHANNYDGPDGIHVIAGCPVSNLLELSYIKTKSVKRSASRTLYPTDLDFPNVDKQDKLLWFFPFAPAGAKKEDYFACLERVEARDPSRSVKRPETGAARLNVALGKTAVQSSLSTYSRPNDAQGAVNGRVTGSFGFHTAKEKGPWWQVDLGEAMPIDEVVVYNRLDAARERAYAFTLSLGRDKDHLEQVHAQDGRPFGGADGDPARVKLGGLVARFVRVQLRGEDYLHLDQVEVYARQN